ncbi:MAG: hypothetical protein QNJ20_00215 [Paracoccaceae bacterium]|nr:hypothetical protein [Paracoccaceae bacterium]
MPTFAFRGFETGSPVDITVAQDSASESASVSTWNDTSDLGSLSVSLSLPPRITAPAGVWMQAGEHSGFNVSGPSGGIYDPRYHEITHIWDTDDSGVWSSPENMPAAWNNKAIANGPRIAHVYAASGTYTPSVMAVDSARTTGNESAPTITVLNPDFVYAGNSTIVIALDADFSGKPAGATEVTSIAALDNAISALPNSTPMRILFKRGEVYNDVDINCRSRQVEYIGAWGTGAKPILYSPSYPANSVGARMFDFQNSTVIQQITFTDLDFRSHWHANGEVGYAGLPWWVWSIRRDDCHMTVHDCDFTGFNQIDVDVGSEQDRPCTMIMGDNHVTNWASYGFFQRRNANANSKLAFVGNRITQNTRATHGTNYQQNDLVGNDHGPIRFEAIGQHYIGCNDLYSQCGWSGLDPDQSIQPCIRVNTYADLARGYTGNIERCVLEGGYHVINMAGENSGRVEHPGNYLIDKVFAIGTAKAAQAGGSGIGILCSFGGTTIRNFCYVMPDVPHYHNPTNPSEYIVSLPSDNPGVGNLDEPVAVYNCTAVNLRGSSNDPSYNWGIETNVSGWTSLTVENNVVWAPGLDTAVTADGPLSTDAFPGITPRWPGFLFNARYEGNETVSNNGSFVVSYTPGRDQQHWTNAANAGDNLHMIRIGGSLYRALFGDMTVAAEAGGLRITNVSGTSWSGAYEMVLDEKSVLTIPNTYANPSAIPLPRPTSTSAARNTGDNGLKAYDDLLGDVRPTSGNARGALLP